MNIIMGASGQVGSGIINQLITQNKPVKAVLHHKEKAYQLKNRGVEIAFADVYDLPSLITAFKGGDNLFVITPESGNYVDLIAETRIMLANYRAAIQASGIKKVVGLSSLGAHLGEGSGNLEMSYLLEQAFDGLPVTRVFVRAAYFFSNWLMGLKRAVTKGMLYSFYPGNLSIPMVSPGDIAEITAELLIKEENEKVIYELEGPAEYTPDDVAQTLTSTFGRLVKAQEITRENWKAALQQIGFSDNATENFIKMTEQIVLGRAKAEGNKTIRLKGNTTLQQYIIDSFKTSGELLA